MLRTGGDLGTIASDRGANVVKGIRELGVPQQPCDGHVLGIAIEDALGLKFAKRGGTKKVSSNPTSLKELRKATGINKYLAASTTFKLFASDEFEAGANAMVAHHQIRWRSTRGMLLRQAELAEEVMQFAVTTGAKKNFAKKKPDDTWRAYVNEVSALLTAADAFYGYIQSTTDLITVKSLLRRRVLMMELTATSLKVPNTSKVGCPLELIKETDLSAAALSVRRRLLTSINAGPWGGDPPPGTARLLLLDPSGKSMLDNLSVCSVECKTAAREWVLDQLVNIVRSTEPEPEPEPAPAPAPATATISLSQEIYSEDSIEALFDSPKKRGRDEDNYGDEGDRRLRKRASMMLSKYEEEAEWTSQGASRLYFDSGRWWIDNADSYGKPLQLVFAAAAGAMTSSCGSESIFSYTGRVLGPYTSQLDDRFVEMRTFISRNKKLRPVNNEGRFEIPYLPYREAVKHVPGWAPEESTLEKW